MIIPLFEYMGNVFLSSMMKLVNSMKLLF